MNSFEYLKILPEATWGTAPSPATPVLNTDYLYIPLTKSNSFTMRPSPVLYNIRSASAYNRNWQTGSAKTSIAGNLSTLLYPEQVPILKTWALDINATTMDLGSCTIDHGIVVRSPTGTASTIVRRYLGVKVNDFSINGDKDSQVFSVSMGLVAKATDDSYVTVEQPVAADLVSTNPFLFQHLDTPGYLKLSNANKAEFASFNLSVKNKLDPTFNQSKTITRCPFRGRDVTWTDKIVFASNTDRAAYEAVTAEVCSAKLDNGTHSLTLDFGAKSFMTAVQDSLDFDQTFYQELTWMANFDPSVNADFVATYA